MILDVQFVGNNPRDWHRCHVFTYWATCSISYVWDPEKLVRYSDCLRAGRVGVQILTGQDVISCPKPSRSALRPTQYPTERVPVFFSGIKRPGREFNHSYRSSAEVKNERSNTSTPPISLHGLGGSTSPVFVYIMCRYVYNLLPYQMLHKYIHGPQPFQKTWEVTGLLRKPTNFMEPEGSISHSKNPANWPCHEPDESSPCLHVTYLR